MATVNFNKNDYVKWAVQGGFGFGQIKDITDKTAQIETPTNVICEKDQSILTKIDESSYQASLYELIGALKLKSNLVKSDEEKVKNMNTELENAKSEIQKLNDQIKSFVSESAKKDEEMKKMKEKCDKAEADLNSIRIQQKTESRFNELSNLKALDGVSKDPVEAKKKLSTMSDETYSAIIELVKAMPKLTEQTQTNLEKSTEQTITTETKVTEAVKKATVDKESTLETVAKNTVPPVFKNAMAKLINKNIDNKENN
jgi:chromosome segregation ATPase